MENLIEGYQDKLAKENKETKMRGKLLTALLDVCICFASVFCLGMILFALYHSLTFWVSLFEATVGIKAKMFWVGIILGICAGCFYFIEIFIREFARAWRRLRPINNEKEVENE